MKLSIQSVDNGYFVINVDTGERRVATTAEQLAEVVKVMAEHHEIKTTFVK